MKKGAWLAFPVYIALYSFAANSFVLLRQDLWCLAAVIPIFLLVNVFSGLFLVRTKNKRLRISAHGAVMLTVFAATTLVCVIYHIILALRTIPGQWQTFLWSAVLCVGLEWLLFWNGILCVYLTSYQMGIKLRVVGAICGMIPVVNLIALGMILRTVYAEVRLEADKEALNEARKDQQLCRTKYPLLLVHGVFFRDNKYINYWGRIPAELKKNGAVIHYGNHQSAASVADSARELKARVEAIVTQTGCEKVNIIAHSKGGLDCRFAIAYEGMGPYVASLTTVNTPHRGCLFADYLLKNISESIQEHVADVYDSTLRKLGDPNPSFLAAVYDLTDETCRERDAQMGVPEGILCQSIGTRLRRARSGRFPMNFTYHLAKLFDGPNDGLVSEKSFAWGESYQLIEPKGRRGISHGDIIDMNRENFKGFDVREFYVDLVNALKEKGL